jgi:hypothetical protein
MSQIIQILAFDGILCTADFVDDFAHPNLVDASPIDPHLFI